METALKIGQRAMYRGGFGLDGQVACTIIDLDEKNGERIYVCRVDTTNEELWGYADQFVAIK